MDIKQLPTKPVYDWKQLVTDINKQPNTLLYYEIPRYKSSRNNEGFGVRYLKQNLIQHGLKNTIIKKVHNKPVVLIVYTK